MKLKTSCFNKTLFKQNLLHYWPIWSIYLVYNLFVLPFLIYLQMNQLVFGKEYTEADILNQKLYIISKCVGYFSSPIAAFAVTLVTVMAVFSYLYIPRASYMLHAMPITRKTLFLTNYISGLVIVLVPQIIAFVSSILITAVIEIGNYSILMTGFLYVMGMSVFFYSLSIFVGMFTGQILALPVFQIVINFLVMGLHAVLTNLLGSISYGMTGNFRENLLDRFSPLFYLENTVKISYDYGTYAPVITGYSGGKLIFIYAVLAIPLTIAAFMIYKIREIERAGDLLAMNWLKPLFRWGVAVSTGSLVAMIFGQVVGSNNINQAFAVTVTSVVIFGLFGFFGSQMLMEKQIRIFQKKRLLEASVFTLLTVLLLAAVETNMFGQETRIPDTNKVAKAYINLYYPAGGSDEAFIDKIEQIQLKLIKSKKTYENYFAGAHSGTDNTGTINIKYIMDNGEIITRRYHIPTSKDFSIANTQLMNSVLKLTSTEDAYLSANFGLNYSEFTLNDVSLDLYAENDAYSNEKFSEKDANTVFQALQKDLSEGKMDKLIDDQYYDADEYQNNAFYNSISFNYYCEDGIENLYDEYNKDTYGLFYNEDTSVQKQGTASISFDKNCTNLINALIQIGAINSVDELISIKDKVALDDSLSQNE